VAKSYHATWGKNWSYIGRPCESEQKEEKRAGTIEGKDNETKGKKRRALLCFSHVVWGKGREKKRAISTRKASRQMIEGVRGNDREEEAPGRKEETKTKWAVASLKR